MYLPSKVGGLITSSRFKNIHTYCMFIGYPRSGHSLIGALINAHPNAIFGIETDALRLINAGFSKNQILYLIFRNSKRFTRIYKNSWSGYSYRIPDSHQGRYTDLLLIGDKQGGKSTNRIGEKPFLLPSLKNALEIPIKLLHVVRNPFDIVSTTYERNVGNRTKLDRNLLESEIEKFFEKADINNTLLTQTEFPILTIHHEIFIENPKVEMKRILKFVGLKTDHDFINKCSSITYKKPHQSRFNILWPEDIITQVQSRFTNYPFLKHYKY